MGALAALLWLAALASILHGVALGRGFPLGNKFPAFDDILIYRYRFLTYHTAAFFRPHIYSRRYPWPPPAFAYPPGAAPVYAFFYRFAHPDALYLAIMALWTLGISLGAWRTLRGVARSATSANRLALTLPLFSFPVIFLAQRANLELFVWMLITAAVLCVLRDRDTPAAALFALAAAIKLYPLLLLGLFISRRHAIRSLLVGVAVVAGVTLAAIAYTGPTFSVALHGFVDGVLRFKTQHAEATRHVEAIFDHSLFSPLKLPSLRGEVAPAAWTTPYYVVAGLGTLALFFLRVRHLPLLNRLVFLTCAMILLPPVSYEYTLVHLYLSLLLLLGISLRANEGQRSTETTTCLIAIAAILTAMLPLAILGGGSFLYAGQVQLVALLVLVWASLAQPWELPRRPA